MTENPIQTTTPAVDAVSRHAVTFVLITVFLDMVGFGIIVPVLPELIETVGHVGVDKAAVISGQMFAAFCLAQFLFAPLMGNLADRFGRRPMLLLAILGLGLDFILSALAPTLFWLFVGRVLAGVCGSSWIIASAYIADVTAPEKRAQAFGMMGAAFGVGFVVGPAIGGILGELGPRVPFWAAAGISLLNLIYGWFFLKESLVPENRRRFEIWRANPFGAFRVFSTYPGVLPMVLVLGLFFFSTSIYPAIWAFWGIAKFGWSELMIGLTLGAFGVISGLFQGLLTGRISAWLGEWETALAGLICGMLVLFGYGFVGSIGAVIVLLFLHGPEGFAHPVMTAILSKRVPEDAQGELQGGISAVTNLAMLAGTLVFSSIFGHFMAEGRAWQSPNVAFWAAGACMVVVIGLFIALKRAETA